VLDAPKAVYVIPFRPESMRDFHEKPAMLHVLCDCHFLCVEHQLHVQRNQCQTLFV
jgi:hypothetical protein